jgi:hypothetical protein
MRPLKEIFRWKYSPFYFIILLAVIGIVKIYEIEKTISKLKINSDKTIKIVNESIQLYHQTKDTLFVEKEKIIVPISVNSPKTNSFPLWLLIPGAILFFIIGSYASNQKIKWISKAIGISLAATSILKITVDNITFELKLDNPTININPTFNNNTSNKDTLLPIDSIGPFASGDTSLLHKDSIKQYNRLKNDTTLKQYSEILIFGGVDKRPPKRESAKKFGDNLSLAEARANKVADSIKHYFEINKIPLPIILTFPKGAKYYGEKLSDLNNDRFVKIYGRKNQKEK